MWYRAKFLYKGEIVEGCVNAFNTVVEVRKECRPDVDLSNEGLMLPASIDLHVHLRDWEQAYKETVITGTSEAVYGGVGMIVDMPNTIPPLKTYDAVVSRLTHLDRYARTDFSVFAGVPETKEEAQKISRLPIPGFKVFPEDLEKLDRLEGTDRLKVIHPEVPLAVSSFRNLRSYWMELAAVLYMSGRTHVTHSTGLETIRLAKSLGFTADFTLHHFLVQGERDCLTKVNPPIRDATTRSQLLLAFYEADLIASDHAPHSAWEKRLPYELCPPGIAGVSFTTPFVYSLVFKGVLDMGRALDLLVRNPARVLGIKAGEIDVGYPANFVVIAREDWRYSTKFSKVTQTPFDLYPLEAKVKYTIVRGKVVYDGEAVYPVKGLNPYAIPKQGVR
ncbi:MAG: dihydroorotase [Thermoprotei archaeon]